MLSSLGISRGRSARLWICVGSPRHFDAGRAPGARTTTLASAGRAQGSPFHPGKVGDYEKIRRKKTHFFFVKSKFIFARELEVHPALIRELVDKTIWTISGVLCDFFSVVRIESASLARKRRPKCWSARTAARNFCTNSISLCPIRFL